MNITVLLVALCILVGFFMGLLTGIIYYTGDYKDVTSFIFNLNDDELEKDS